ncbi:MAG: hypothetical protein P4L90_19985 [Rhodopila sp.]|nr:hypothetical protein [Rhodopila sp.]
MNGRKLHDRLYLGLGLSARHIGQSADAFRPKGPFRPLDKQNRFLRLPATFVSAKGNDGRTNVYGEVLWHGIFDASYTRPGDYLVLETGIYFVASQVPLLPVLCVGTNRTISVARPNMQTGTATNSYGGYTSNSSLTLMEGWPASVLGENKSSAPVVNLPADQTVPYWNVLVPAPAGITLSPGDLINDDLGRTAVIAGSELTDLGWRLSAKMATT